MSCAIRRAVLLAFACTCLIAVPGRTQELTTEQREVWAVVEAMWERYAAGDVQGMLDRMHDEFTGWEYGEVAPRPKSDLREVLLAGFAAATVIDYDLEPVVIRVIGDAAVVHYRFAHTFEALDGERHTGRGRYTDLLIRSGGRWIFVADHGGPTGER